MENIVNLSAARTTKPGIAAFRKVKRKQSPGASA